MNKTDTGGAAFPAFTTEGMSLRDYFAAKAMQALLFIWTRDDTGTQFCDSKEAARLAYKAADEMLKERSK